MTKTNWHSLLCDLIPPYVYVMFVHAPSRRGKKFIYMHFISDIWDRRAQSQKVRQRCIAARDMLHYMHVWWARKGHINVVVRSGGGGMTTEKLNGGPDPGAGGGGVWRRPDAFLRYVACRRDHLRIWRRYRYRD
jgi:hypothetical protein